MSFFVIVYLGIGAYFVLGVYLTQALERAKVRNGTWAPARVVEKTVSESDNATLFYHLKLELTVDSGEEPIEATLDIDETTGQTLDAGAALRVRYRAAPETPIEILEFEIADAPGDGRGSETLHVDEPAEILFEPITLGGRGPTETRNAAQDMPR